MRRVIYTAPNLLDTTPQEFSVDQYGWICKLSFSGDEYGEGKYLLWINGTLATELP